MPELLERPDAPKELLSPEEDLFRRRLPRASTGSSTSTTSAPRAPTCAGRSPRSSSSSPGCSDRPSPATGSSSACPGVADRGC